MTLTIDEPNAAVGLSWQRRADTRRDELSDDAERAVVTREYGPGRLQPSLRRRSRSDVHVHEP